MEFTRNVRIHEASHKVVAMTLEVPTKNPVIFKGGGSYTKIDIEDVSSMAINDKTRSEALKRAAVCLAGHCGEAIAAGYSTSEIIGVGTADYALAMKALDLVEVSHDINMKAQWIRAEGILRKRWPLVLKIAEMIQEV